MHMSMRWVIAGVAVIVLASAALAVFLALRLRAPAAAEAVDLPTWAQRTCGAEVTYAEAVLTVYDGVDPATLDLGARKQRAERIGRVEIEAARRMAETLRGFEPPEPARVFHEALIRDAEEEASATREQLDAIAKATTAQQIALANAQMRFRRDSSSQQLTAAAQNLPPDVVQAMTAEPSCQSVPAPMPGAPGQPGVAPSRGPA